MVPTKEEPRDPRPEFCRRLELLGVTASPIGPEPTIRYNVNAYIGQYVIAVTEDPIRQILIGERYELPVSDARSSAEREIRYLIPDPRIKLVPRRGASSSFVKQYLVIIGLDVGLLLPTKDTDNRGGELT